jgi:hypothetical protein
MSARLRHYAFTLLFAATASVFFATVVLHVWTQDYKPLAAFCLPVLAVFFTFTSLLYMRGNTINSGGDKVRTLFAAETAMQATVCYLLGILLGTSLYGVFDLVGFRFDPAQPEWKGLWLLAFLAPYALMMLGVSGLLRAACVIAPQFLKRTSPYEVWRRIERRSAFA